MAIRAKTSVKLMVTGNCPSHSLTQISVRDVSAQIDEPLERGGTNAGPTPTDTALAALIGCTNVIGNKCADKLGVDIGHLQISATCDFNRLGVTLSEEIDVPFETINLVVICDGTASEAELEQVKTEVSKYCPLSKLFRQAGTVLNEEWKKAT